MPISLNDNIILIYCQKSMAGYLFGNGGIHNPHAMAIYIIGKTDTTNKTNSQNAKNTKES